MNRPELADGRSVMTHAGDGWLEDVDPAAVRDSIAEEVGVPPERVHIHSLTSDRYSLSFFGRERWAAGRVEVEWHIDPGGDASDPGDLR